MRRIGSRCCRGDAVAAGAEFARVFLSPAIIARKTTLRQKTPKCYWRDFTNPIDFWVSVRQSVILWNLHGGVTQGLSFVLFG